MKPIPKWVSGIAWRLATVARKLGSNIPFSKHVHNTMNTDIAYSSEKLLSKIDMEFRTMKESVEWVTNEFKSSAQQDAHE